MIQLASPMHDIGKLGIPDDILHKPDILTGTEFDIIKMHSNIGYEMLRGSELEMLRAAWQLLQNSIMNAMMAWVILMV